MNTISRVILILICTIFISCRKDNESKDIYEKYKNIKLTQDNLNAPFNDIDYTLDLPDTLKVNQPYQATFKFKSDFDTIVEPMKDTVTFRTIMLYYYNPVKVGVKNRNTSLVVKDSLYIPNKEFTLGNVKFSETGKFLFLALIDDKIMYNFYSNGKRDSIHYARKVQEIKKEVIVVE